MEMEDVTMLISFFIIYVYCKLLFQIRLIDMKIELGCCFFQVVL